MPLQNSINSISDSLEENNSDDSSSSSLSDDDDDVDSAIYHKVENP